MSKKQVLQPLREEERIFGTLTVDVQGHMTGDQSLLTRPEEKAGPGVTFGDDNKGYTLGYGMIKKDNVIIEKVALVDGLKHNLLGISQPYDNENKVHFSEEFCFISNKKSGDILLTGNMKGNVYIADFKLFKG